MLEFICFRHFSSQNATTGKDFLGTWLDKKIPKQKSLLASKSSSQELEFFSKAEEEKYATHSEIDLVFTKSSYSTAHG